MSFLSRVAAKPVVVQTAVNPTVADKRAEYDLDHMSGATAKVTMLNPPNPRLLLVTVRPPSGSLWVDCEFRFKVAIPDEYPNVPPDVKYVGPNRIWHPNIEGDEGKTEWGVCLNILRKDWTPVMGVRDVVMGLEMMFFEPCMDDPLPGTAKLAAQQMLDNPREFEKKTVSWAKGRYI
jgi:ubiquitin-conjugating enzyme E2 M